MNSFSKEELTIILGYYYFESSKNGKKALQNFVTLFNDFFMKDVSEQIINYQLTLFKNVDSSHNGSVDLFSRSIEYEFWNYYILQDRIDILKKLYKSFKSKEIINKNTIMTCDDYEAQKILNNQIDVLPFTFIEDTPKELYKTKEKSKTGVIRDIKVSSNALKIANYKCECDAHHELFLRKDGHNFYTEGHHLIPLEFQDRFEVNLDVEANIVSLCSNCHNHLHYGCNPEEILKKLFTKERQKRLLKCGIKITLDELIELYK